MNERGAGAHLDRVARYLARRGLAGPGVTIAELPGDASDRRYVRLRLADGTTRMLMVHSVPLDSRTPYTRRATLGSKCLGIRIRNGNSSIFS